MTVNYLNKHHATLVYAFDLAEGRGGWFWDRYSPGVQLHYGSEGAESHELLTGTEDGTVYKMTGSTDSETAIGCHVRTEARDQGDSRLHKLYGDVMLDADTRSTSITAKIGYDNNTTQSAGSTVTSATRTMYPIDPDSHNWVTARNVCLELEWDSTLPGMAIYTWEPRWHEENAPIKAFSWQISPTDFGLTGFVYTGYIYLPHVSTANLTLVFTLDGTAQSAITIAHGSGSLVKSFVRLPVMKAKMWSVKIYSTAQFRISGKEAELLVKQWGVPSAWRKIPMFADAASSEAAA